VADADEQLDPGEMAKHRPGFQAEARLEIDPPPPLTRTAGRDANWKETAWPG
jgi:hypothetical protein